MGAPRTQPSVAQREAAWPRTAVAVASGAAGTASKELSAVLFAGADTSTLLLKSETEGLDDGMVVPTPSSSPEPRPKDRSPANFGCLLTGSFGCTTWPISLTTRPALDRAAPCVTPAVPVEATVAPAKP